MLVLGPLLAEAPGWVLVSYLRLPNVVEIKLRESLSGREQVVHVQEFPILPLAPKLNM